MAIEYCNVGKCPFRYEVKVTLCSYYIDGVCLIMSDFDEDEEDSEGEC